MFLITFSFFTVELPQEVLVELLIKMADIEYRLLSGTSENLQLSALVAAFFIARSHVKVPEELE